MNKASALICVAVLVFDDAVISRQLLPLPDERPLRSI
jgi:hypothetical protein